MGRPCCMPKFHAQRSLRTFLFRYFASSHASNSWSVMLDSSGDNTPPCGTPSLEAVNRPRSMWPALRIRQRRSTNRLREEFDKLQVEINDEKSRTVDLGRGDSFGFLGF